MRGHIRERSPGHLAIVIDVRDPESGKRKRKWHSFRGTKREAQTECARLIGEHKAGRVNLAPKNIAVGEFLARWLDHARSQIAPRSHERYSDLIDTFTRLIGNTALAKLQPVMISQVYAKALKSGRRDGKGGLSARTVLCMHAVLHQALAQAVRWDLLGRNPADAVEPPKVERRQMNALDTDATATLVEAARSHRLHIPVLLAVMTGMRRGEIAALRWKSIDLERGTLAVVASAEQTKDGAVREKPPKNGKGRAVELPALVVEELRRYRAQQAEGLLRLGIRLNDDHHVVTREDGLPLKPHSLSDEFRVFLLKRKLKRVRLHDLRHTHATLLLKGGVHPKIAQERLGHSSIALTLDLYSHVLPGMQRQAADMLDQSMRDAFERTKNKR
jgi:integrase